MSRFAPSTSNSGGDAAGVFALLSLVKDPDKYNAKMQEMLETEARLNEKIALAGVAEQIVYLRAQADQMLVDAEAVLVDAKRQATNIIDAANKTADEIVKSIKAEEHACHAQCQKLIADGEDEKARIIASGQVLYNEGKADLEAKRAALQVQQAAFQGQLDEQAKEVEQFELRKQALETRIADFNHRLDQHDREYEQFKDRRDAFLTIARNLDYDLASYNAGR